MIPHFEECLLTIHYNKNITKQSNSYAIGICITLQCLLQSTKRALINLKQQLRAGGVGEEFLIDIYIYIYATLYLFIHF